MLDDREELVAKFQKLAGARQGQYVTKDEFLREYKLTTSDILRAGLDGYAGLVLAAGGKVSTSKQIYADSDLLDDIVAVSNQFGRLPTTDQYEAFGKFSISNVKKRFGSWSNALKEVSSRLGRPPKVRAPGAAEPGSKRKAVTRSRIAAGEQSQSGLEQFSAESQRDVASMASHYAKLYCLERQMRSTIAFILRKEAGESWWDNCVPRDIRDNATRNVKAEERLGVTPRSERLIDYTTLGELGVIVDANWKHFGGVFKNQEAMKRVMRDLNMLRAFVAHCTPLPADEVIRLDLNIKDWLRQVR